MRLVIAWRIMLMTLLRSRKLFSDVLEVLTAYAPNPQVAPAHNHRRDGLHHGRLGPVIR